MKLHSQMKRYVPAGGTVVQVAPRLSPKFPLLESHLLAANKVLVKAKVLTGAEPVTPWMKLPIVPWAGEEMSIKLAWQRCPVY